MNLKNQISLVVGKKGSGKTLLTKQLIEKPNRLIVIDSLDEYDTGAIVNNIKDFILFIDKNYYKDFKITYKPIDKIRTGFDLACQLVYTIPCCTFVVEELNLYCNSKRYPESFEKLIRYGRHQQIDIIAVTQRPVYIPTTLTSQLDKIYTLQQQYPEDIKTLTGLFGYEAADIVRNLKSEYPDIEYFVHPDKKVGNIY